ncbi:MAG: DUF882 domain-containing protein [Desulfobacterales bacterium]
MTRREAIKFLVKSFALASVPVIPRSVFSSPVSRYCSGRLNFYNMHTNESLRLKYLDKKGKFDSGAIDALNHFFRCHYNDKIHPIAPDLYLFLDNVRTRLGKTGKRYRLYSGYRSPEYNQYLRRQNSGVAQKSYHLKGMAADVALEGVRLRDIHRMAINLKNGGVGKYSHFVHLDVGPARTW